MSNTETSSNNSNCVEVLIKIPHSFIDEQILPSLGMADSFKLLHSKLDHSLFVFRSGETEVEHSIGKEDVYRGVSMFLTAVSNGELPGVGSVDDLLQAGSYFLLDVGAIDCIVQFAIMGEVVYG